MSSFYDRKRDRAHVVVSLLLVLAVTLAASPAFGGDRTETSGDILRIALPAAALGIGSAFLLQIIPGSVGNKLPHPAMDLSRWSAKMEFPHRPT